ncbi:MAG: M48 family metallopeptidase [Sulfurimonas sp.]|nr:M48 family metallopeptidase [Sulfurimonas sp.]
MNELAFEDLIIHHTVNKKLKHSYINITSESEILLKTPRVSKAFVYELLQSKKKWIDKQLVKIQNNPPLKIKLEDEVILFGEIYSIDTLEASSLRIKLEKSKINSKEKTLKYYDIFYKQKALEYITPRVEYFAKIMDFSYQEIKYRKMKRRWGSCSSQKVLSFNTELIKIKKDFIDYVIVHELAHLKYMNHSVNFHALVDSYLPHASRYRDELKSTRIAIF